jgi:hypothetical protein
MLPTVTMALARSQSTADIGLRVRLFNDVRQCSPPPPQGSPWTR